jgi:hypothetical protein
MRNWYSEQVNYTAHSPMQIERLPLRSQHHVPLLQRPAIAHDQSNHRQTDFDVEAELPVFARLIGVALWPERERHRHTKGAPPTMRPFEPQRRA